MHQTTTYGWHVFCILIATILWLKTFVENFALISFRVRVSKDVAKVLFKKYGQVTEN